MQNTPSKLRKFNVKFDHFAGKGVWRGKSSVVYATTPEEAEMTTLMLYKDFFIKITGTQEMAQDD